VKVGDLVKYCGRTIRLRDAIGIILRTAEQTNNGDFEVHWWKNNRQSKMYCRGRVLELLYEVVSESR